jgi:ETC complex I subunit-like protein
MATLDATVLVRSSTEGQSERRNTGNRELNYRGFPYGAPQCRIYRPSPSVMQSGRLRSRIWVLQFEPSGHRSIEPLMGWTASDDPFAQIRLRFPTVAAAVDYAERQGLDYRVVEPPVQRRIPKSYRETIAGPAAAA